MWAFVYFHFTLTPRIQTFSLSSRVAGWEESGIRAELSLVLLVPWVFQKHCSTFQTSLLNQHICRIEAPQMLGLSPQISVFSLKLALFLPCLFFFFFFSSLMLSSRLKLFSSFSSCSKWEIKSHLSSISWLEF